MTNLTTTQETNNKRNFKDYLHIANVFLLYFRKVNTYILPAFLVLLFWFEYDISIDTYAVIALAIPAFMVFSKIKSNKINETVGLFVPYKELKNYTNHIILDVICLYFGLNVLCNILIYILIEWNWYIVMALPITELLDMYIICQVVFIVTDAYRSAKENKVETNPIFNFIKNNEFGDWLGVCFRLLILVPVYEAANNAIDSSYELMDMSMDVSTGIVLVAVYTVFKYRKELKEKVSAVINYAKTTIKIKDIVIGVIATLIVGTVVGFGTAFVLGSALQYINETFAKTLLQECITTNLFLLAIYYIAIFSGIYAMLNSNDAIKIAKKFMGDEKKEEAVAEEKQEEE